MLSEIIRKPPNRKIPIHLIREAGTLQEKAGGVLAFSKRLWYTQGTKD
jgi:hypothetical protein